MNDQMTVTHIEEWLARRVTEYGRVDAASFDPTTQLTELGFDSVYALTLCGDIEDEFHIEVEPAIVWDHPTIRELATAVRERLTEN